MQAMSVEYVSDLRNAFAPMYNHLHKLEVLPGGGIIEELATAEVLPPDYPEFKFNRAYVIRPPKYHLPEQDKLHMVVGTSTGEIELEGYRVIDNGLDQVMTRPTAFSTLFIAKVPRLQLVFEEHLPKHISKELRSRLNPIDLLRNYRYLLKCDIDERVEIRMSFLNPGFWMENRYRRGGREKTGFPIGGSGLIVWDLADKLVVHPLESRES